MQQAETADSIRAAPSSGGKFTPLSGHPETVADHNRRARRLAKAALARQATRHMMDVESELAISVERTATLMQVCREIVQEAECETGFYYRHPGYHRERIELLGRVQCILEDEMRRIAVLVDAQSGIVAERIAA